MVISESPQIAASGAPPQFQNSVRLQQHVLECFGDIENYVCFPGHLWILRTIIQKLLCHHLAKQNTEQTSTHALHAFVALPWVFPWGVRFGDHVTLGMQHDVQHGVKHMQSMGFPFKMTGDGRAGCGQVLQVFDHRQHQNRGDGLYAFVPWDENTTKDRPDLINPRCED